MLTYWIRWVNELKDVHNDTLEHNNDDDSLTKVRRAGLAGADDQRGLDLVKSRLQLTQKGPSGPGVEYK